MGGPFMNSFPEYHFEKIETMGQDELIENVQLPKLFKQLKYVFSNSIFYREKFKLASIELSDIKTVDDL
jgi:phenylacetate-coenzyme A ligase PaaK-like adenylate-forming protein